MRRRRIKEDNGRVSLFPFLAVLICTMGALLVLLVVISKRAQAKAQEERAAAIAESAAEPLVQPPTDEDAHRKLAALLAEIQQLEQLQAEAKKALADRRDALGHLEDHTRRLNEERARLIQAAQQLEREGGLDDEDLEKLQTELKRVQQQLADSEKLLAEATEQAGAKKPAFAIIPFDGQNRTYRRPIYLECGTDSVVLQPEGIVFEDRDFEGDLQSDNPLAAALRAAGEHLARSRPNEIGQIGRPYPLLIVKPSSIKKYYEARAAMEAWKDEFGYEMVNEDWDVAFPPPDPQLAQVIQFAVDVARRRQQLQQIASESMARELAARSRMPVDEGPQSGPGFGRFIPAKKSPSNDGDGSRAGGSGHDGSSYDGSSYGGSGYGGSGGAQGSSSSAPLASLPPGQGPNAGLAGQTQPSGSPQPLGSSSHPVGSSQQPLGSVSQPLGSSSQPLGSPQPIGLSPQPLGSASPPGSPQPQTPPGQTPARAPQDSSSDQNPLRPAGSVSGSGQSSSQSVNPQKQESIADMRGENWALPGAGRGLVAVTRQVRVECLSDRLVIVGRDGRTSQQVIPLPGSTREEVEKFVSAVWEYMDSWGIAGRGMYWKPVLNVYVRPGAEQRAGELKALLEESGLELNLLR
jgi:hypothetical protein